MNLLDIRTRTWSEICLKATAPHLDRLLGAPLPSTSVLVRLVHTGLVGDNRKLRCSVLWLQGPVSSYFVRRYGFSESCSVVCFTGDNPGRTRRTRHRHAADTPLTRHRHASRHAAHTPPTRHQHDTPPT